MTTSVLDTPGFWRDLGERLIRQLAQTALPIVLVVGVTTTIDAKNLVLPLLVTAGVTVLNALRHVAVTSGEGIGWQLLDRAVPAAAGVLLGFVPISATDLFTVDWKAAGFAAVAAAVSSVLAFYLAPPAAVAVAKAAAPDYSLDELL